MTGREELEQAIAALEAQRPILGDAVVETSLKALHKQLEELEATGKAQQRKLVTILFMDTVGSTEMVRVLDPEDNLAIMDTALHRLSVPVEQHGGRVTRYMGDGFLAIFGLPLANENDPVMGVRAGLGILSAAEEYAGEVEEKWKVPGFSVRVGINTGTVVVGGRSDVTGTAVNLAARLESAAKPGTLLISHYTYQHVRGVFDLQPLAPIEAKGFPVPVPVYRVLAARARTFRSRRRGVEGVETHMVGRDGELKILQEAYTTVIGQGEHRLVTIAGEAGIGKSRLLYEFENWLESQPSKVNLFRGRAQSESQNLPYALLRNLFAFHFEIQDDDPADLAREKVVAGFSEGPGADEAQARFIGHLLGYDFGNSRHLAPFIANPQKLRDRALNYLQDYFEAACGSSPVIILLEDLHWADESSLDVFSRLSSTMQNQPMLVIGSARPGLFERRPQWNQEKPFHHRLDLQPLTEQESGLLVAEVLKKAENIPHSLLELIATNAEGNPFYVEELLKMLIQQEVVVKRDEGWQVFTGRLAEVHVPPTLSGVLQARLDSLVEAERTTLQRASVVGRIFWDVAVAYLSQGQRETHVKEELLRLIEKEIVFRRDGSVFTGAGEYFFKHALFRQVTYESVLMKERRSYHSRTADWLIEQSGERSEEVTGLIANHLEHAGRLGEALVYLQQAAGHAAQLFALVEALRFYDQAVGLVVDHPEAFSSNELAQLRAKRGGVHALAVDFEAAIADMYLALWAARDANDLSTQRTLLTNLGMVYRRADDYENALSLLSQAVEVARASGDQRAVADTLYHLGSVFWSQGENNQATPYHQEALEICRSLGLTDLVAVQATHGRAEGYVTNGRPDLAMELFKESLQLSRQIGDRSYEAENLQMIAMLNNGPDAMADYRAVRKPAEEALEICRAAGLDWHLVPSLYCLSVAHRGLGEYQMALHLSQEALQVSEDIGSPRFLSFVFHQLAMHYQDLDLLDQAELFFQRALQASEEVNSAFWLPTIQAGLAVTQLRQGYLMVGPQLEETLAAALERGQKQQAAHCLEGLAEIAIAGGKAEKAIEYANRLKKLAEPGCMRERMAQAHRWRGIALQALGQSEAAGEELDEAARLSQVIGSPRLLWDVHDALAGYYDELGNRELAVHHQDEVQKIVAGIAAGLEDEELKAGLPLDSN